MTRIVGPSGVVIDVPEESARGLIRDGFAELADGESTEVLEAPDTNGLINPEASPAVVTPVGNSVPELVDGAAVDTGDGRPRGNASREEWVTYALANGKTEDDLNGLKQGEIRALFEEPNEE